MKTLNDMVATEPFPFVGNQTEVRASGMRQVTTFGGLVALKVIADGPDGIKVGDQVLVPAADVRAPYATAKYKLADGKEFILIQKTNIRLVVAAE